MAEMTVAGLRVILEVARTGSFSAAAVSLGYTQSAISRQVAATEQAAASPLFTRHARGVRPTPAGEVLLRHAGRVIDSVAAAEQELAGMRDRLAGRLMVGGFPTACAALIPRAMASLRREHPALAVRLLEAPTPQQLRALRRRRLEVAVVAAGAGLPDLDLDALELHKLRSARGAGIAVAEDHQLASRGWVTPDDLTHQPWIVGAGSDGSPEFGAWPEIEEPSIAYAVRDWPTRLGLVASGLGIALVPGMAADLVPQGVRWIPVRSGTQGLGRTVWAATSNDPSPGAVAMIQALQRHATAMT